MLGLPKAGPNGWRRRAGYTLFELVVTIAVIVAISAMAWPSFRSRLELNRIENAARETRALARETRRLAIHDAIPYALDVGFQTPHYRIVPATDPTEEDRPIDDSAVAEPATPTTDASGRSIPAFRPTRRRGTLPPAVRFVDPWQEEEAFEPEEASEELEAKGEPIEIEWNRRLICFPDGSSTDGHWLLEDRAGRQIEVFVDGVTLDIGISKPRWKPDPDADKMGSRDDDVEESQP